MMPVLRCFRCRMVRVFLSHGDTDRHPDLSGVLSHVIGDESLQAQPLPCS